MIRQLNKEETRELLLEGRIGHLGCVEGGVPYVVPVSYLIHEDSIYVHSLLGRKIRAMRENPRVCFQVEEIKDAYHWRSALAFGQYHEVTDEQERNWAVRRLLARFPQLTPIESVPVHDGQSSVIVFRIRIEEMSGVGEG
ncbi:MAG TPA: pyridoxamine 5'-phosphate oxidase family protein [Blastocatellia bacterium]|nr:pyridoxamine 5'-phosphate oxidase family protein [Blastocatellia bacterium]